MPRGLHRRAVAVIRVTGHLGHVTRHVTDGRNQVTGLSLGVNRGARVTLGGDGSAPGVNRGGTVRWVPENRVKSVKFGERKAGRMLKLDVCT